jgi:cyclopropane-fatty-acyl-phospholipid synthase
MNLYDRDWVRRSTGCTLSAEQFNFVNGLVAHRDLRESARIELSDYRDLRGPFDKIASVGVFEHVGRRRLENHLGTLHRLLRPGGLLINHRITRPESVRDDAGTRFVRRKVFPGGELAHLSDVIRPGFEVLDVENLRPHYMLTCRDWVERSQQNAAQCLRPVDRSVYRTWLLALAVSAAYFEDKLLNLKQVLLYKPGGARNRAFTREYIYA